MATDSRLLRDDAARRVAVDPARNVVLEASAGTGKTRVLVDRYVGLLRVGVEPANILAVTFTRKAAAEMRDRIVSTLRDAANHAPADAARWRELRDRLNEITISTIDAFCLALLREFPLEADLDPGFDVADETAAPQLVDDSLDQALRICRSIARDDEDVALLFAQLGEGPLRRGLASLLSRRLVAEDALRRVLVDGAANLTVQAVCRRGFERVLAVFSGLPGGLERFLATGPDHMDFHVVAHDLRGMAASLAATDRVIPVERLRIIINHLQDYVLTKEKQPRKRRPSGYKERHATAADEAEHWRAVMDAGQGLVDATRALKRDVNVVLSRAVRRVFVIALRQYRATLERRNVLDFAELLIRARALLGNMDEFAKSRYLLESRYQHVLVDEFQDTSRAQWDLVSLLVRAWGEGVGAAHGAIPPSIFVVGDRKQSIYGFRDAEVVLLDEAATLIASLNPESGDPVHAITHSFRSVAPILAFVNDLCADVDKRPDRPDAFRYDARDAFPLDATAPDQPDEVALGLALSTDERGCAMAVADEIVRLLTTGTARDRTTGIRRPVEPGDIAILFRSRRSHSVYEDALDARGVPSYVYKGLGFFESEETRDLLALVRFLADPASDLRAAALVRSRFARLSDAALQRLSPGLAAALITPLSPEGASRLPDEDRILVERLRPSLVRWLALTDVLPPADVIDRIIDDTAYAFEWRGPRLVQVRENVKKFRGLVRRMQNRGYLTMARLAAYLETLSAADEANAAVEALNAVNLMTVHASKGLEFPIVFVVDIQRGVAGKRATIRVSTSADASEAVAVGDFLSESDDDAPERDHEETKRLLYVAVTRGRDRLYLAQVVKPARPKPTRGSLLSACPQGFVSALFGAATAAVESLEYRGQGGAVHRFTVVPVPDADIPGTRWSRAAVDPVVPQCDFAPLVTGPAQGRRTVTAGLRAERPVEAVPRDQARLLVGRLVHRLFQFGADDQVAPQRVASLLSDDERYATGDPDAVVRAAIRAFVDLRRRQDVRDVLAGATTHYEVPFSLADPAGGYEDQPGVMRGVIDCLAERPDGTLVILDFKTGRPSPGDAAQIAVYEQAVRQVFPGRQVTSRVVYGSAAE